MSTIKVDTITTRTGSGNITVSNTLVGDTTGTHTGNIATNSITTQSGTDITIPTGKKLVVTDAGGLAVPNTVVQVAYGTQNVIGSTTSTSYVATDIYTDITPKFSTSKILVQVSVNGIHNNNMITAFGAAIYGGLVSGSLSLLKEFDNASGYGHSSDHPIYGAAITYSFLTGAVGNTNANRYRVYYKRVGGSGTIYYNNYAANQVTNSCVTLMEIAQ